MGIQLIGPICNALNLMNKAEEESKDNKSVDIPIKLSIDNLNDISSDNFQHQIKASGLNININININR